MELFELLSSLLNECRLKFGDRSLVLLLENISIANDNHVISDAFRTKIHKGWTHIRVQVKDYLVSALSKEVRELITEPNESIFDLFKHLRCMEILRKVNKIKMSEIFKNSHEQIVFVKFDAFADELIEDDDLLKSLSAVLEVYYDKAVVDVNHIDQIVLPIAISKSFYVYCKETNGLLNMELFDSDNLLIGKIIGIYTKINHLSFDHKFTQDETNLLSKEECTSQGIDKHQLKDDHPGNELTNEVKKDFSEMTRSDSISLRIKDSINECIRKFVANSYEEDEKFVTIGFDSLKISSFENYLRKLLKDLIIVPYGCAFEYSTVNSLHSYLFSRIKTTNAEDLRSKDYYPSRRLLGKNTETIVSRENFSCKDLKNSRKNFFDAVGFDKIHDEITDIVRKNGQIPLSSSQKRFIFLSKFLTKGDYQFVERVEIESHCFDKYRMHIAFNKLIAYHNILRSRYGYDHQEILSLTEAHLAIVRQFSADEIQQHQVPKNSLNDEENLDLNKGTVPLRVYCIDEKFYIEQHHIMTDGLSLVLMERDFIRFFRGERIKPIKFSYAHFAYIDNISRNDKLNLYSSYWKQRLSSYIVRKITCDGERSPNQKNRSKVYQYNVGEKFLCKLRLLTNRYNITEFKILLIVFHLLIYKLYEILDYCTGIVTTNREYLEFEDVIGCFVNIIPFRVDLSNSHRISDVIKTINGLLTESLEKQIPFEDLISNLKIVEDRFSSPLFQIALTMDNTINSLKNNTKNGNISKFENFAFNYSSNTAIYEQIWYFIRDDHNFTIRIEYDANLFSEKTIKYMMRKYLKIFDNILHDDSDLQNLSCEIAEENLHEYNLRQSKRRDFPLNYRIIDMFAAQNRSSIYSNLLNDMKVLYSNSWFERISNQLARLVTQETMQISACATRSDDAIILIADRSKQLLLALCALWKSNYTVIMMNKELPEKQFDTVIEEIRPLLLLSPTSLSQQSTSNQIFIKEIDNLLHDSRDYVDRALKRSQILFDIAYATQTSGSTGQPKTVSTSYIGLNNLSINYAQNLMINNRSNIYQVVSPSFDIFIADLIMAWCFGGTLTLAKGKIPNWSEMEDITHAYIMPAYLSTFGNKHFKELKKLEAVNFGGDMIQENFLGNACKHGVKLFHQFGLTESTIYSTFKRMRLFDNSSMIGKMFYNQNLIMTSVERVFTGEMICCITGIGISRGYYANKSANASTFRMINNITNTVSQREEALLSTDKRYLWSGDQIRIINSDGEMKYLGRVDYQIKIRGLLVNLADIESQISKIDYINLCAVNVSTDNDSTELIVYIEPTEDSPIEDYAKYIKKILSKKLSDFMIPRQCIVLQKMPTTYNGKIDRSKLRFGKVAHPEEEASYPLSKKQQRIIDIFKNVLNKDSINCKNSFFSMGGDSLKALYAIQKIQSESIANVQLKDIFYYPVFEDLLNFVSQQSDNDYSDADNKAVRFDFTNIGGEKFPFDPDDIPLSFAQERLWYMYEVDPNDVNYILQMNIGLKNSVDHYTLCLSINYLLRENLILRTIIDNNAGDPRQRVLSLTESYVLLRSNLHVNIVKFDIYTSPPFVLILEKFEEKSVFKLWIHHILIDEESFKICLNNFFNIYTMLLHKKVYLKCESKYENYSYAKFSNHQRNFWKQPLERIEEVVNNLKKIEPLTIVTDFNRPAYFISVGKIVRKKLHLSLEKVEAFCANNKCTVFTVLLAAYILLVRSLSGQNEFIIGSVVSERDANVDNTVGFFLNTVILMINTNYSCISDFLNAVQNTILKAIDDKHLPFEIIIQKFNALSRDTSKSHLFQHSVVLQNVDKIPDNDEILYMEEIHQGGAKYDQTWFFCKHRNFVEVKVEYNKSLFRHSTIDIMIRALSKILESILCCKTIDQIKYVAESELLKTISYHHSVDTPNKTEARIFEQQCKSTYYGNFLAGNRRCIKFGESMNFIHFLRFIVEQTVIKHYGRVHCVDDCFAVVGEDDVWSTLSMLTIQTMGASYSPIDNRVPRERFKYALNNSRSLLAFICNQEMNVQEYIELPKIVPIRLFEIWKKNKSRKKNLSINRYISHPSDLSYIIYTSGTTGNPKGVCIEHRSVINVIEYTTRIYGMNYSQNIIYFTRSSFDATVDYIYGAALNGATIIIKCLSTEPIEIIKRNLPVTLVHATPTILSTFDQSDLMSIRSQVGYFSVGGEKLLDSTMNRILECGLRLIQVYGPTEATVFQNAVWMKTKVHRSTMIGRAIDNLFAYVINKDGSILPFGFEGEYLMTGENIGRGYMKGEKKIIQQGFIENIHRNREDIAKGINLRAYRSGDAVKMQESGEFEYIGRSDLQIKIDGYRIELGEIESAITNIEGILMCVALQVKTGKIVAFYTAYKKFSSKTILAILSETLPYYMLPSDVVYLEQFLLNSNSKADRNSLRTRYENSQSEVLVNVDLQAIKTTNTVEEKIAQIWSQVLDRRNIQMDENFFAVGGYSLLAIKICSKISLEFKVNCPIHALFKNQTISKLAGYVRNLMNTSKPNCAQIRSAKRIFPVRVCQLQQYMLHMYQNPSPNFDMRAYNTGFKICFDNEPNVFHLKVTVNRTIMLHPILRTTFKIISEVSYQEIFSGTESFLTLEKSDKADLNLKHPLETVAIACSLYTTLDKTYLTILISHLLVDGYSMGIIAEELYSIYFKRNKLPVNYSTYIQFSEEYNRKLVSKEKDYKSYWQQKLKNVFSDQLETDHLRSPNLTNKSGYIKKTFAKIGHLLRELSSRLQCSEMTINIALLHQILMNRLSKESQFIIACPIDMQFGFEKTSVGYHIITVPIVLESSNFTKNYLSDISDQIQDAIEYSFINSDVISELLQQNNNSLSVCVVSDMTEFKKGQLECVIEYNSGYTKFELTFFIRRNEDDVDIYAEYMSELFYNESVKEMIMAWANLVTNIYKNMYRNNHLEVSNTLLSEKRVDLDKEKILFKRENPITQGIPLLEKWGNKLCDRSEITHRSLSNVLYNCFFLAADRLSMVNEKIRLNYMDIINYISYIVSIIEKKTIEISGEALRADNILPIIEKKTIPVILICIAEIFSGGAYLPLDIENPNERHEKILNQLASKLYVSSCDAEFSHKRCVKTSRFILFNDYSAKKFKLRSQGDDLTYLIYTSGTTDEPKGVAVKQCGVLNMALQSTIAFQMKTSDCVYQFTNFTFDNSVLEIIMALSNSSALYIEESLFTPAKFTKIMREWSITHALFFPGLIQTFTQEELSSLAQLRYWIVGAEKLSDATLNTAIMHNINVIQNYGPTETTACSFVKRMKACDFGNNIGKAIKNFRSKISRNNEFVSNFITGELILCADYLMRGYINESSKEFYKINYERVFFTGDIVKRLPNGDHLIIGRNDCQIKLRGFRIRLTEIEVILQKLKAIKKAKAIYQEVSEMIIVYFTLNDFQNEPDVSFLRRFCLKHLPYYMVPSFFKKIENFPLTGNSKIDIHALSAISVNNDQGLVAPTNSTEFQLCLLFKQILKLEHISINDDFFYIGGNSLNANNLIYLINQTFCGDFEVETVFRLRTVHKIASFIKNKEELRIPSTIHSLIEMNKNEIPLSFQQEQMIFLNQTKNFSYYNLLFTQRFDQNIEYRYLQYSFHRLVMRQHSLRTIFPETTTYQFHQHLLSGTETFFSSNVKEFSLSDLQKDAKKFKSQRFDLNCSPPVKFIAYFDSKHYTILLLLNHIISDAWSTRLIETELSELYKQAIGLRFTDNQLSYSYINFTVDQLKQKANLQKFSDEYVELIKDQLDLSTSCLTFCERTKQSVDYECFFEKFPLAIDLNKINKIFLTTPFVFFISVSAYALYKLSNSTMLIIAAPVTNRKANTQSIVGNFLNNMIIPFEVFKDINIIEYSDKIVEKIREYDYIPYSMICDSFRRIGINLNDKIEVYLNCRYDLEDGSTNELRDISDQSDMTLAPKCLFPLEIDVDYSQGTVYCTFRLRSDIGSHADLQRLKNSFLNSYKEILRIDILDEFELNNTIENMEKAELSKTDRINDFGIMFDSVSRTLKSFWIDCLELNDFIEGNFFLCGGNSLRSLKLARRLTLELHVKVEIEEIFENSDFSAMCRMIFKKMINSSTIINNSIIRFPFFPNSISENVLIFFHPLFGGAFLPYLHLSRNLSHLLINYNVIGIQHSNPFFDNNDDVNKDEEDSIENLCMKFADLIRSYLIKAKRIVFIGASIGGILAYQTAKQLIEEGFIVEDIICIDGVAQPSAYGTISYEEHIRQTDGYIHKFDMDENTRNVIIDNSWKLLRIGFAYIPKPERRLKVQLLKVKSADEERDKDYGWSRLCEVSVFPINGTHRTMLDEENSKSVAEIIYRIISD